MRHDACRFVLIDDDIARRARVSALAHAVGLRVPTQVVARDTADDMRAADLVFLAADRGGVAAAVAAARRVHPAARLIVMATDQSQAAAVAALRAGADDFTPDNDGEIVDRIAHHLARLPDPLDEDDGGLVGGSPALRRVRAFVTRLAASDATVLITGETGTGKELVARMLHRRGRRAARPLIAVNCAAIPETLIEAELFGHVRGAFTGASRDYPGKLGLANGGTLMLDEIGELTAAGQAKVLRALESREVWPIGGSAAVRFDARLIAATNRDLEADAAAGRYRSDLFYRLAVARVHVPPLRDRREDIVPIVRHLLADIDPSGRAAIEDAALDRLAAYDWPGNVRELRNVVEVALLGARRGRICADGLPDHVALRRAAPGTAPTASVSSEAERSALVAALARAGGNKSRAAAALACSRMTLYRRLVRYGIIAP